MTRITKYYGAPGTGKTYTLINKVKEELESGINIKDIAYLGFTRAAAYEALSRATKNFNLRKRYWFRTIHSTCLNLLRKKGLSEDVVTYKHREEFCARNNMEYKPEEIEIVFEDKAPEGNLFFNIYSYVKNSMIDIGNWKLAPLAYKFNRDFLYLYDKWISYKTYNFLIDFIDMTIKTLESNLHLPTKILFVDEFQDLSPLQFKVIELFMENKDRIYYSGDDDQAIYRFQGARPEIFLNTEADEKYILPRSYRLPSKIWSLSKTLIDQNKIREPKNIMPRCNGGIVKHFNYPSSRRIIMEITDTTYLLFRTNWLMRTFGWELAKNGILYRFLDKRKDEHLGWLNLRKYNLYHNLRRKDTYYRDLMYLVKIRNISKGVANFIRYYIENYKERINPYAINTFIGTIHSAKGREADTIILFDDITKKVYENLDNKEGLEDERRIFYVGMTRAKNKLVIIHNGVKQATLSFNLPDRLGIK